jgi:lysyl-tRNA synthetase class 2
MKRLLAAGYARLFQLGPCFRRGERGALHNPEYTMLEWYRAGADGRAILADTTELVQAACRAVHGEPAFVCRGRRVELAPPWEVLRVRDAFRRWAGWDPVARYDAERFEHDLVHKVEPAFPADRPVVLMGYPAEAAAMSRLDPAEPGTAERWELYLGGVELVNAFTELTDAAEQRRRLEQWAAERRAAGREVYPLDEAFLAALEAGLPPAGGAALGVDRLVMLLAGETSLDRVLPFREPVG